MGGIPYAALPVEDLRWAPPEAAVPWAPSILDATEFGPNCWQVADPLMNPGAKIEKMSEDCLYLNVFTPSGQARRSQKLPVEQGGQNMMGGGWRREELLS